MLRHSASIASNGLDASDAVAEIVSRPSIRLPALYGRVLMWLVS